MYLHAYLRSAKEILAQYDGTVPFPNWLKNHFRQHKKFGSKDRKMITDLCYCYYRLGRELTNQSVEERLLSAQFLCHTESPFIKEYKSEWLPYSSLPLKEKMVIAGMSEPRNIFSCIHKLSAEINSHQFIGSLFIQPDLFLRIRPHRKEIVLKKLTDAAISFEAEGQCIRLPNMTKVDGIIEIDSEAVIQDKNSQKVLDHLLHAAYSHPSFATSFAKALEVKKASADKLPAFSVWDCCAASGGKSILLHDHFPEARLTVSDIRESILANLKKRFGVAGIKNYKWFVHDLANRDIRARHIGNKEGFDVVICDAPCSGSGTWSRTPEQLYFFAEQKINEYAALQQKIAINAISALKKGGYFLYITCSVFKKENEEAVEYIVQETGMQLIKQEYHKGYADKADTLFSALLLR